MKTFFESQNLPRLIYSYLRVIDGYEIEKMPMQAY